MAKRITNEMIMDMLKGHIEEQKKFNESIIKRVDALEGKKSTPKKSAPKTPQYATRREAIEAKYSEEERKAWGEAKKAERTVQTKAYELTNSQFAEKVEYKVWRKQYEANLAAIKAGVIK